MRRRLLLLLLSFACALVPRRASAQAGCGIEDCVPNPPLPPPPCQHSDKFELEVGLDYITDEHGVCRGMRWNLNVYWKNLDTCDSNTWQVFVPTIVLHHPDGTDETISNPDFRRTANFFDQLGCPDGRLGTACGPATPSCVCINDECECWQLFSHTQLPTNATADTQPTLPVDVTFLRREWSGSTPIDRAVTIPVTVTVLQNCLCGGNPC